MLAACERRGRTGDASQELDILNPADRRERIGRVRYADALVVEAAIAAAEGGAARWAQRPVAERAALLERAADLYQQQRATLIARVVREAGRTLADARRRGARGGRLSALLRGPGPQRALRRRAHRPLGPVACISPWNFPVAIFTGQIAAALASGNTVLAKPAEQTSATAALAVQLLLEAGMPDFALQLLPGEGERVGMQLVGDARVQGVLLTGSTAAARAIARALAKRGEVTLVAETGGQNAMIVDSTALARAGRHRRAALRFRFGRPALLGAACTVPAAGDRAPVLQMLQGGDARAAHRRPGLHRYRRRTADR